MISRLFQSIGSSKEKFIPLHFLWSLFLDVHISELTEWLFNFKMNYQRGAEKVV